MLKITTKLVIYIKARLSVVIVVFAFNSLIIYVIELFTIFLRFHFRVFSLEFIIVLRY